MTFVFAYVDPGVSNHLEPYGFDGPTGRLGRGLNIFPSPWPDTHLWLTNVGATRVYPGGYGIGTRERRL